jgi:L-fucose mutarotase
MRASLQKCRYVSNTDLSVFRIISASLHIARNRPASTPRFADKAKYTLAQSFTITPLRLTRHGFPVGLRARRNPARASWEFNDMLKNIDPALNADVLHALRAMGHGDTLVISDTNFPSDSVARQTTVGKVLHIDNVSAARAMKAILSVLPLDTPLQPSVGRMEVMGAPDQLEPVQAEVQKEIDAAEGKPAPMYGIERFAFYEKAKQAYCVITTGETRFYGCFLLTKGVIPPAK